MIANPYLLITFVPAYLDDDGALWLDLQWHRDFVVHLDYLRHVTLAAPVFPKSEGDEKNLLVKVEVPEGATVDVCALPHLPSLVHGVRALPALAKTLWRAIGDAEIIQSDVVGWPFAFGWVANPIAMLRRKHLVIVVESATWRLTDEKNASWKHRLRHEVGERLNRFFVNRADLNFFTHPGYRDTLWTNGKGRAVVVPASWIDDADILTDEQATASWAEKAQHAPRLLFAGRLVRDKGVEVLLEAIELLESRGVSASIDIIGSGTLRLLCEQSAARRRQHVRLRVLDPVPYGAPFFTLVRNYSAVLVPTLSDEQPRILFDAWAQAVPVIASSTVAHSSHVVDGVNGMLVRPGDVHALADVIAASITQRQRLEKLGHGALTSARETTLRRHHDVRFRAIRDQFGGGEA